MMNSRLPYLLIALVLPSLMLGGERSSIRGLGMARTMNAASRGLNALGINPANLGMEGERMITFDLIPFGIRMSSELISYDTYRDFFTGVPGPDGKRQPKFLTNDDKERILSTFPRGVANTQFDFEITPLALSFYHPSVGGIGISVVERLGTRLVLPRDYAGLFLQGFDSSGSSYDFSETDFSAWWWREYNVAYGMRLPVSLEKGIELYAGVGLKYVSGFGILETERYRALVSNQQENGNQFRARLFFDYLIRRSGVEMADPSGGGEFSFFPQPAGTGFGVDIGVAARLPGVNVHLSVTDIGTVTWKRNLVETFGNYDLQLTDPFEKTIEDTIQTAIRGKNRPGSEFSTSLPTKVRIGVAFGTDSSNRPDWMPNDLVLAADLTQGFNESMGNFTTPRISVGAEYTGIPVLKLRTGLSIGDDTRLRWAMGLGFDARHFSLDLATENLGLLFSLQNFDLYSLALGFRFRF